VQDALDQKIPWYLGIGWARQAVLLNMGFNLGVTGLLKFKKMLAACQSMDFKRAAAEMRSSAWAGQVKSRAEELIKQMETGAWA
jgi:lysozyme